MDGTFLKKGALRGTVLAAVALDANNQLKLLAFGQVHKESAESWAWFIGEFVEAFSAPKVSMSSSLLVAPVS